MSILRTIMTDTVAAVKTSLNAVQDTALIPVGYSKWMLQICETTNAGSELRNCLVLAM